MEGNGSTPSIRVAVLAMNLTIVAYLAWRLKKN